MYNYRNKRKKTNKTPNRPSTIEKPLNDVWESYQEPKSYHDFGISDEAFTFLSNREECLSSRKKNQFWKDKNEKIGKTILIVFGVWIVSLVIAMDHENYYFYIIPGLLFLIEIVLFIISSVYQHKIINTYDDLEWNYQEYTKFQKHYDTKKEQFLIHTQELADFKSNKEISFLNNLVEKLKRIQGRTYRTEDEWRQMSDRDFEFEIGKVYSRLGYQTKVTKRSGDGGVDVIATKDNETVYIQCKHYGENTHLGAPELQAFWGCCSGNGISKGVMVCTSGLTKDAQAFANKLKEKLEIIGMKELMKLDKTYYQSHPINSQIQFTDAFKNFLSSNCFIDCDHLWLKSKVYYKEEDAEKDLTNLTKWKNHNYLVKNNIVNLTNKIRVYLILLVPDYALEEVKNTNL